MTCHLHPHITLMNLVKSGEFTYLHYEIDLEK